MNSTQAKTKPTQEKLKPKLFSVMKNYTPAQFGKDVVAGIIVAIIALPLSIALALASGVERDFLFRFSAAAACRSQAPRQPLRR